MRRIPKCWALGWVAYAWHLLYPHYDPRFLWTGPGQSHMGLEHSVWLLSPRFRPPGSLPLHGVTHTSIPRASHCPSFGPPLAKKLSRDQLALLPDGHALVCSTSSAHPPNLPTSPWDFLVGYKTAVGAGTLWNYSCNAYSPKGSIPFLSTLLRLIKQYLWFLLFLHSVYLSLFPKWLLFI